MSASDIDNSTTGKVVESAIEAFRRGYTPVPVRAESKAPALAGWGHHRWESEEQVREQFSKWVSEGITNIGLVLGESSGGLVDVDVDSPKANRLASDFLPPTAMISGRLSYPKSHRWYRVEGELPSYRKYINPEKKTLVELRVSGLVGTSSHQTVIPPSIWKDKDNPSNKQRYKWFREPWGGDTGPATISGRELSVRVATLALLTLLVECWPGEGSRHDAYLALAGGFLRYGSGGDVHPFWSQEQNLPTIIRMLATHTGDHDGAETRVHETLDTTVKRLREGKRAVGFPRLGELVGEDYAEAIRRAAVEVTQLAGWRPGADSGASSAHDTGTTPTQPPVEPQKGEIGLEEAVQSDEETEESESEVRLSTWEPVNLEPYILRQIVDEPPSILQRTDGKYLIYPGKLNGVFGKSESGKSWVAFLAVSQELAKGQRVLFLDAEDSPAGAVERLWNLGVGDDEIRSNFTYINPDSPIADMERNRWGNLAATDHGKASARVFYEFLDSFDPTLIVVDGLNVLYGIHGHDTNDATSSAIVFNWLKRLTREGRSTVIIIDHTGKNGGSGASPIGAHHKIAAIQGSALRVDVIDRPIEGYAGGHVQLTVFKDRPSQVRKISSRNGGDEQVAGEVWMDSSETGILRMRIDPPDPNTLTLDTPPEVQRKLDKERRAQERAAQRQAEAQRKLEEKEREIKEKRERQEQALQRLTELVIKLFNDDLHKPLQTPEVVNRLNARGVLVNKNHIVVAWKRAEELGLVEKVQGNGPRDTYWRLAVTSTGETL